MSGSERLNSPMKHHTPTPAFKIQKVIFLNCALKGWVWSFNGALGNLSGAPAGDLTMAPPASIAAAPSVPSRNNGSSSSSSSSSSCEADSMESAILTYLMCLAQVTFLTTVLTSLMGTSCLETLASVHVRIPVQSVHFPVIDSDFITGGRPHFVVIGMVFQYVIGSAGALPPTSPHCFCRWPVDREIQKSNKMDIASRTEPERTSFVCESCHHVIIPLRRK